MLSRQLLLPGELPAMTHLGCTLLRHCLQAAIRYGRYHLGMPVVEVPEVPVVHLRPYLAGDVADPLDDLLLRPGGKTAAPLPVRSGAALAFHRLRLWLRQPPARPSTTGDERDRVLAVRRRVSDWVPLLGDALLSEVAAVANRRRRRSRGRSAPPCSSPLLKHWREITELPSADIGGALTPGGFAEASMPDPDPPRGRLRDTWLLAVLDLQPRLRGLGADACRRGLLADVSEVYFLPYDHLDVLAGEATPDWLPAAVSSNRREWSALLESQPPDELLADRRVGIRIGRRGPARLPTALAPLP